jgi:hypothetical protein
MKLFEEINMIERLDQLIRLKATGTPNCLAIKLDISKRQTHRYIEEMKEMGLKICYCKKRCTYYYEEDTFLKFKMYVVENGKERNIVGGENNSDFLDFLFDSAKKWHCEPAPLHQVNQLQQSKQC